MKKIGFIAVALATLFLVGCEQNQEQKEPEVLVNSITLDKTELTLSIGAEAVLKATVDPVGAVVTWASSDNSVVLVTSGGAVAAQAEGTAVITATAGDKTAECVVTVTADAFYDEFNVLDYGFFGELIPVSPAVDTLMDLDGDGKLYKLSLQMIQMVYAWDGNANFVAGKGFVGNGLVMAFPNLPMWVITEVQDPADEQWVGVPLSGGGFVVRNTNGEVIPYVVDAGQIDVETYGDWVQLMYTSEEELPADFDINVEYEKMTEKTWGAMVGINTSTANGELLDLSYGLYAAHINNFVFLDAEMDYTTGEVVTPAMFAADVTWANMTSEDYLYGYKVDMELYESTYVEGEGGDIKLVKPYEYSTINRIFDRNGLWETAEEEASPVCKLTKGNMAKYHKEMPKFAGNKDNKTLHMAK